MSTILTLAASAAALFACPSPQVHDGDSIRCGRERLRLAGIDAPEMRGSSRCHPRPRPRTDCDEAAAIRSRDNLRALVARGRLVCRPVGRDRYGRLLVDRCLVAGVDLGAAQLAGGFARAWR